MSPGVRRAGAGQGAAAAVQLLVTLSFLPSVVEAQVTGVLDDCLCDIDSIDNFNTFKIFPKIKKLQERDYFRYYKVSQAVQTVRGTQQKHRSPHDKDTPEFYVNPDCLQDSQSLATNSIA